MEVKGEFCVGCETCYGCGRKDQISYNCDECGCEAIYHNNEDGKDYCRTCLNEYLNECWQELSLEEKLEALENFGETDIEKIRD